MDNKRWYSRFGTIFWWCLAILPLIVALIQFIGFHLTFNSGITSATDLADYHDNSLGIFHNIFSFYIEDFFSSLVFPPIGLMFKNLFELFDINGSYYLWNLFGWMTSVAFYHVLFDFSVWIFNWIHALFDRWGCFK